MRVALADSTLARYAGRFVWLELDFDNPRNRDFLVRHGVMYTPSLFVLDAVNDRAIASHFGGMTRGELIAFLDRGSRRKATSPADSALAGGEQALGHGRLAEACQEYRRALDLAPPGWRERNRAVTQLSWALMANQEWQACAETAAVAAPSMPRGRDFARLILAGLSSIHSAPDTAWIAAPGAKLLPLAVEAVELRDTERDVHFQLYQQLMIEADVRGDSTALRRWGERWLGEIEATRPRSVDERTALDIARVDAVSLLGTPERAIPALIESERLIPDQYNASLRLAQVELQAARYEDALAACDRGLGRATGPIARSWLLQTRARVWIARGDSSRAIESLDQARAAARFINTPLSRDNNIRRIERLTGEARRK